ncbi:MULTISPECIES: GNAT family N-acetyltransferase [unclassified Lentilitoribacter]|jgi:ribosomal protein S18 acetylase RimI-like enzyme|uniref:GNAT family N-acetyltransferase n=1 Tax=unclassified Lentilitoribacter TaxID=2647570 RepID=UPI0013A6B998|nr:GNAT family N-acetyltransferase [Lentilitoribacter sp. Alg239-R112]
MTHKIRSYRADDLDALYAITLATGDMGEDASHLYADGKLLGNIYSAPYAMLMPKYSFVVEDDEGVAGFVVGVPDTLEWSDLLEREWWPSLREQLEDPSHIPPNQRTEDQRRAYMIHYPDNPPQTVTKLFPAHIHMNLHERVQGAGLGRKLLSRWLDNAAKKGVESVHIGANRSNHRAVGFWQKQGFDEIKIPASEVSRTIWMGRSV